MNLILILLLLAAVYAGVHALLSRMLGVSRMPIFGIAAPAETFAAHRSRRLAVRLGALGGAYLAAAGVCAPVVATHTLASRVRPVPGSPAERAGIREGDLVVSAAGVEVDSFSALVERIRHAPGSLPLVIERGRDRLSVNVTRDAKGMVGLQATGEQVPVPRATVLANLITMPLKLGLATARAAAQLLGPAAPAHGPMLTTLGQLESETGSTTGQALAWVFAMSAAMIFRPFALWVLLSTWWLERRAPRS